jgi:hypothetical protein
MIEKDRLRNVGYELHIDTTGNPRRLYIYCSCENLN